MKIKGPLLSVGASGSVGNVLTFSKRKTHQHARNKQGSNKKLTPKQAEWRFMMDFVSLKWQSLTQEQKDSYSTLGRKLVPCITGFQYLAQIGMHSPKDYLNMIYYAPLMDLNSDDKFKDYATGLYSEQAANLINNNYKINTINLPKERYLLQKRHRDFYITSDNAIEGAYSEESATIAFTFKISEWLENISPLSNTLDGDAGKGFYLYMDNSSTIKAAMYKVTTSYTTIISDTANFATLMHIILVFTAGHITVYKNGVFNNVINTTSIDLNASGRLQIMKYWGGVPSTKYSMGQLLFLNRSLSADECMFLYKSLRLDEKYE